MHHPSFVARPTPSRSARSRRTTRSRTGRGDRVAGGGHAERAGRRRARAAPLQEDVARASARCRRCSPTNVLVAYCDLMRTRRRYGSPQVLRRRSSTTSSRPVQGLLERAGAVVRGLRVRPTVELDPATAASVSRSRRSRGTRTSTRRSSGCSSSRRRSRRSAGDASCSSSTSSKEVVRIDDTLPNVMRSVFQTQREVGHVYLGAGATCSRRSSTTVTSPSGGARSRSSSAASPRTSSRTFVRARFAEGDRGIDDDALARLLELTDGHPYATQELAYFTWEEVPLGHARTHATSRSRSRTSSARSTTTSPASGRTPPANERLVLLALHEDPGGSLYAEAYRRRHGLPAQASVQRAVAALTRDDIVERAADGVVGDRRAVPRRVARPGSTAGARGEAPDAGLDRRHELAARRVLPAARRAPPRARRRGHDHRPRVRPDAGAPRDAGLEHTVVGPPARRRRAGGEGRVR